MLNLRPAAGSEIGTRATRACAQTADALAVVSAAAGTLVIGLQKNSSLTPIFNAAIQRFAEDGTTSTLVRTWFDELSQCGGGSDLSGSRLGVGEMLGERGTPPSKHAQTKHACTSTTLVPRWLAVKPMLLGSCLERKKERKTYARCQACVKGALASKSHHALGLLPRM
jgi:hypothetical protein